MLKSPKLISLDGSTLEGGGQLVRVAFSLSAITRIPVHVYNIRANRMSKGRSKGKFHAGGSGGGSGGGARGSGIQRKGEESNGGGGGAKESHLAAVLWLAGKCDAYVEGAEVGSKEVLFVPGGGSGGSMKQKSKGSVGGGGLVDLQSDTINLERPGSTCLILQCILPYLLFTPPSSPSLATSTPDSPSVTELTLHGGTNVSKAMTTDYVQHVFLPMLRRMVGPNLPDIQLETVRRGWAGSANQIGEVKVRVSRPGTGPLKIDKITSVERGDIEKISVVIVAHGEGVIEGILEGLRSEIATLFDPEIPVDVMENEDSGDVRWLYVLLVAHTSNGYRLGRDHLGTGRRPKNAAEQKKIVEECVRQVVRDLAGEIKRGGCVDEFMGDQIVLFQALARGMGRVNSGTWREVGRVSNGGRGVEVEAEVGDEGGSLHTRTVRWVCKRVLRGVGGVEFRDGGQCKGVGWNWDRTDVDGDGDTVELDEERNVRSVEADMERLNFEDGR